MKTTEKKKSKILIVDDNPANIEVAATLLSEQRYLLEFADSGEQALRWVKEEEFDLILLDIMMPGIDGFETCRQIKQIESYKDIPVIFLTAKTDVTSLSKAFTSGGVDYISKPFRPDELLARVATHVELKNSRDQIKNMNVELEKKVEQRTKELKFAYNKLQKAKKEVELLDQIKTNFLNMVSHEIRTPLNGIIGGIGLLKSEELTNDLAMYFEIIENSANRLERFSLQALEITNLQARAEKGLDMQSVNIAEFLTSFFHKYKIEKNITDKKLILNIQTEKSIKAEILSLEKLFVILIDNATVHSPENAPVLIKAVLDKGKVVCEISDKGQGFPASMLNDSMSIYQNGIPHIDEDTGLNFQYVKILMRTLNGKIELNNSEDGGAVVRLLFPVICKK